MVCLQSMGNGFRSSVLGRFLRVVNKNTHSDLFLKGYTYENVCCWGREREKESEGEGKGRGRGKRRSNSQKRDREHGDVHGTVTSSTA